MILYPCECSDDDTGHDFISEKKSDAGIEYVIECSVCLFKSEIPKDDWDQISSDELKASQRKRTYLTRYPRIEPHTGLTVSSRADELEKVRAAGFHVAEHGINEKFDDDTSEFQRAKRRAQEERKVAIRKKRETMIREGVIKAPKRANV